MRLSSYEILHIKKVCDLIFENANIYLFGSRVNDTKKGGDIDLYIKTKYKLKTSDVVDKKVKFLTKIKQYLGEQKIDIIVHKDKNNSIEKEALKNGILL
jgi:predicted nucleotidyltransferase